MKTESHRIKEANDLATLDITTLFVKLLEHEQELTNLKKHEKKKDRKNKKIQKGSLSH